MFQVTITPFEEPALVGIGATPFSAMVDCYELLARDVSEEFLAELAITLGAAAIDLTENDTDKGVGEYTDMDHSNNYTIWLEVIDDKPIIPKGWEIAETSNQVETKTIVLTDRPSVEIVTDDWPRIAYASAFEGEFESQANRRSWLSVRRHADGRTVVYGEYLTQWANERNRAAGELLAPGEDPCEAILRVGRYLGGDQLVNDCLADLPAERI